MLTAGARSVLARAEAVEAELTDLRAELVRLQGEVERIAEQKRILSLSHRAALAGIAKLRRDGRAAEEGGPGWAAFEDLGRANRRLEDELARAAQRFDRTRAEVESLLRRFGFRLLPRRIRRATRVRLFGEP